MNEFEPGVPDQTSDPEATRAIEPGAKAGPATDLPERVGRYRPLRAIGRGGMGVVYEAEPHFRRELEIAQATHRSPHAKIAGGLGDLGACLFRQGRKSEAADLLVQALDMHRELGVPGGGLLQSIGNAAFILDDAGRHDEAATLHREYIALAGELFPPRAPNQTDARARYLDNLMEQGQWEQAEEQARLVLAWRLENLPADSARRPSAVVMLAQTLVGQGRAREAEEILREAEKELASMEQVPAATTARTARVRRELEAALAAR